MWLKRREKMSRGQPLKKDFKKREREREKKNKEKEIGVNINGN